jgi:L-fuconolactonase
MPFIVDAQVHIWGPETAEHPWRTGQPLHREVPLGAEELLREMDAAGVAHAMLVPPYWEADRDDVVMDAVRRYPRRFSAMARPDTESPEPRVPIASWFAEPGIRALRCSFNRPRQIETLLERRMDRLWADAELADIPVMMLVPHVHMHAIDRIAARHPALKITLCHLGLTSHEYDDVAFRDIDKLLVLARRANVSVNASALPAYTQDRYPYCRLHQYLRRIYDAFGPSRIFWGSDYSRLSCSYFQAVTMFTEEIPWLSTHDKEWIMGRGLCTWLGWTDNF